MAGGTAAAVEDGAESAAARNLAQVLQRALELWQQAVRRDSGVTADGSGAGNEDIAAGGARDDGRAREARGARAEFHRVIVGGHLQRILDVPRRARAGGKRERQGGGFGADGGGGGKQLLEARAVVLLEDERAGAAEEAIILESARPGFVDRGDVVPDAREMQPLGCLEEIGINAAGGRLQSIGQRQRRSAEQPAVLLEKRQRSRAAG